MASLIERKQHRARLRIIEAADDLFADRGFNAVSVSDIAERAEVGRTTFFRHFGDKQEVVFAREREVLALIAVEDVPAPGADPSDLIEALRALQPIILGVTSRMTADADAFRRHMRLVQAHPELGERDAAKLQEIADLLGDLLTNRGWDASVATLSGRLAVACFQAARRESTDPTDLAERTRRALERILGLRP
ncbi:helix-turn-helix domain-containing protein [Microbacterium soli]|uniref:TetR/AcrR family transcriptional regulator n=1 Tax=Microbacterium soli TaxID=446075 RepID=A0ABP7MQ51_9MICO